MTKRQEIEKLVHKAAKDIKEATDAEARKGLCLGFMAELLVHIALMMADAYDESEVKT